MRKVLKTIGNHAFSIILVIALLVIQANCDLTLPEYTADIVNVGIANKGIESPVPIFLGEKDFQKLQLLLNEKNKELLTSNYLLFNTTNYKDKFYYDTIKEYSLNEEDSIYMLKYLDIENEELSNLFLETNFLYTTLNTDEFKNVFTPTVDAFTFLNSVDDATRKSSIKQVTALVKDTPSSIKEATTIETITTYYSNIGIDIEDIQLSYITDKGLSMLGLACLVMVIAILTAFIISKLAASIAMELRGEVVKKVMSFSNQEYEEFQTASLITRTTNDVQQAQMFMVMALRTVIYAPIMGLGSLGKVSDNQMSWILGISLLCVLSLIIILFVLAMPKFKKIQNKIDKLNLVSREILTGVPVIRAFSTEKHEEKRFDEANKDLTKINLFVNRTMSFMFPAMSLIMNITSIAIVWIGSKHVDLGTMQVGDLLAAMTYSMHVIMSFLMFSMISIMFPRALVSLKRIGQIFNKVPSIQNPKHYKLLPKNFEGIIEFKSVYFRYPDAEEDVIRDINFKAYPGTTTAFIGSTGSGKSTLINLIPRFFDVTAGKILLDGINIKDLKIEQLRDKIGYVPQKGLLFSGTIASNIAFGLKNSNQSVIEKSAKIAQAKDFIEDKKEGYKSPISQGGTNVSGGQRQRLAIARAIAKNPSIYIFDDSFSALDFKTDAHLRKELAKTTKNATIFIVAQRINTIMNADQIIVLDKGVIVGIGTHEELIKKCTVYKEIALSQLSEEELKNA